MGNTREHDSDNFKAKVVLEMLKEEKSVSELAAEHGVHSTQLHRWRRQALEDLPQVFSRREDWQAEKAQYEEKVEALYTEIGRLTTRLSWLKKRASMLTRDERMALLDWGNRELPIRTQADLLWLNRSGLYYKAIPPSPEEVALKHQIDEIFTPAFPTLLRLSNRN